MANLKKAYKTIVEDHFPDEMTIGFGDQKLIYRKRTWSIDEEGAKVDRGLRYGENPGQEAALYELVSGNLTLGECRFIEPGRGLVSALDESMMVQFGKHPGKINMTDADNGPEYTCKLPHGQARRAAIMKHNNPSGVARGGSAGEAVERAFMADRLAAMGGCVAVNRPLDMAGAEFLAKNFVEVVVAPSYEEGTVELLSANKNLRIVEIPRIDALAEYRAARFLDFKSLIDGGLVVQQSPVSLITSPEDFIPAVVSTKKEKYACERTPTAEEYDDLIFGWNVELGVTSNSVIFVKDGVTTAIGTGEQDRVGCAEIAVQKAYTKHADRVCLRAPRVPLQRAHARGGAGRPARRREDRHRRGDRRGQGRPRGLAHDLRRLLPLPRRGGRGHPPGHHRRGPARRLIRDKEVIAACNEADPKVAMVFTGQRAFKH